MSGWDEFDDAPVMTRPSSAQPIVAVPNYRGASDERDGVRTDIAVRGEVRDTDKTAFDQKGALYERYSKLPEVKNYRVAVQQMAQAIGTGEGPQADLALTYAFAKAMDPESVVREAEQGMISNSQPWFQSAVENAKKQFAMDGAGNYTPAARREIRNQIANSTAQRAKLYNQQRGFFTELATRNNFDPYEIIGEHDANPFAENIRAWGREGNKPNEAETVGGLPKGTDVTFAGDDGKGFDRKKWLLETQGFDPNGEANLVGWLNANSGNPNITMQDLQTAYSRFSDGRSAAQATPEMLERLRSGKSAYQGFDSTPAEQQFKARVDEMAASRDTMAGGADAFMRGAAQVPSFGLVDKATALTDTVFEGGTYDENMDKQRLINTADEQANQWAQIAGEITGAVLTPYGAGARTPMELAKVGAVTSGATEFNQSSAPVLDRLAPTALATATGGALGYGTGKVAERLTPAFAKVAQVVDDLPPDLSAPEFIAASRRQGTDFLPGDIPGANVTQIATALTDNTLGSGFIQRGAEKAVQSVDDAVARTADNLGGAVDDAGAGQAVQRGANAWQDATDAKTDELYQAIPIAPEAKAETANTLAALRDINNPVGSNPALSAEISDPTLKRYQAALEGGGLSWQDMKSFRSYIGGKAGKATFQQDIPKDRLDALYAGLSRDMEATALKQGPQALSAFKRANTYKRAVEGRRENVMRQLLGKDLNLNPEKAFAQIQSWAKAKGGDFAKLSQAVRSLPEPEANAVRATIIDMLGKATDGAQNSVGSVFSPATFATQWNKLSPRAKAVLFQKEHRAALDDLAGISSAMKASQKYKNTSRTGLTIGAGGTAVAGSAGILPAVAAVGGQLLSGAILGSPRVAKWAAALYRKPNQPAAMAHIARLDNIAKAEPVIANEVLQLQTRLRDAFAGTPDRLAATTPDQKSESLPPASTTTAGERQ